MREAKPFLICVQHRILDRTDTRLLATLTPDKADQSLPRLHPLFEIEGRILYLYPQDLLTLPLRVLKNPIANLEHESNLITAALDLVFTGV